MNETAALRSRIRPMRTKTTSLALGIFAADLAIYAATVSLAIRSHSLLPALAFGTLAGFSIGMLFVVGHDACHGSFTASARLNAWVGRIAFLPSLTPFWSWDAGHNRTHHVYTNLKPLDYVWMPFSKSEFDALPGWRRLLERCYRTPLGVGLYYAVEIWWKHLFFARGTARRHNAFLADSLACAAYCTALMASALSVGWAALLTAVVWPFVIWNWMMGWAIYEHHTHPRVPWFDDENEWRAAGAQVRCTVHIVLPGVLDFLLHRIMQHTAHHLDVTVPLYRLRQAQGALELGAGEDLVVYRWSPISFMRHLRVCKLYDFKQHRWVGFDGVPRGTKMQVHLASTAETTGPLSHSA